jgi:hypothetical protein
MRDTLPAGKLVHRVKLRGFNPAKVVEVLWNIVLQETLNCANSNQLEGTTVEDPGH